MKHRAIAVIHLGTWILGNFATAHEVKEALGTVKIWGEIVEHLQRVPGLHIALHDQAGNNLVIEFLDGEIVTHDNPLGVLTNGPPFAWHLANLKHYDSIPAH